VIIETHSNLLIRAIQTMVARSELASDKVRMHWFSRDIYTGATEIASVQPDSDGSFGDWPMDFDDVTLQYEGEYLDAVAIRQG
jgi:predicted ATPase